jgi:hypothetical protein
MLIFTIVRSSELRLILSRGDRAEVWKADRKHRMPMEVRYCAIHRETDGHRRANVGGYLHRVAFITLGWGTLPRNIYVGCKTRKKAEVRSHCDLNQMREDTSLLYVSSQLLCIGKNKPFLHSISFFSKAIRDIFTILARKNTFFNYYDKVLFPHTRLSLHSQNIVQTIITNLLLPQITLRSIA